VSPSTVAPPACPAPPKIGPLAPVANLAAIIIISTLALTAAVMVSAPGPPVIPQKFTMVKLGVPDVVVPPATLALHSGLPEKERKVVDALKAALANTNSPLNEGVESPKDLEVAPLASVEFAVSAETEAGIPDHSNPEAIAEPAVAVTVIATAVILPGLLGRIKTASAPTPAIELVPSRVQEAGVVILTEDPATNTAIRRKLPTCVLAKVGVIVVGPAALLAAFTDCMSVGFAAILYLTGCPYSQGCFH
jgi:hypothetical protein